MAMNWAQPVTPVPEVEAKAILGDMMARIPDRRMQALNDLKTLAADPKGNEVAERGLARDDLQIKKFDAAAEHLDKAAELNARDPWIWYYRSVLKYRKAQETRQEMQGIANMMQDLRAVIDWYPELADAYNMLGMARVEGGGWNSALEAEKQAVALSPRNVEYQFNLGQIYIAGKKWDQARDVFTRLKESFRIKRRQPRRRSNSKILRPCRSMEYVPSTQARRRLPPGQPALPERAQRRVGEQRESRGQRHR